MEDKAAHASAADCDSPSKLSVLNLRTKFNAEGPVWPRASSTNGYARQRYLLLSTLSSSCAACLSVRALAALAARDLEQSVSAAATVTSIHRGMPSCTKVMSRRPASDGSTCSMRGSVLVPPEANHFTSQRTIRSCLWMTRPPTEHVAACRPAVSICLVQHHFCLHVGNTSVLHLQGEGRRQDDAPLRA